MDETVQAGVDSVEAIEKVYSLGIQRVGKLFETGQYFLPKLVAMA